VQTYVTDKLERALRPYELEIKEVDVTFEMHDKAHGQPHGSSRACELTVYTLHNGVLNVSDSEPELYASIDFCMDKLKSVMRKTKEKGLEKGKWPGGHHPGSHAHGGTVERLGLDVDSSDDSSSEEEGGGSRRETPSALKRS